MSRSFPACGSRFLSSDSVFPGSDWRISQGNLIGRLRPGKGRGERSWGSVQGAAGRGKLWCGTTSLPAAALGRAVQEGRASERDEAWDAIASGPPLCIFL